MIKKINGKGMMDLRSKSKGDLFIKFNVKYPKDNIFTEEEIETVKKILSKECTNEIQMEKDIRTGKIEGTKTYLDDYKEKKDRRTNSNPNEESPPQCTQQ